METLISQEQFIFGNIFILNNKFQSLQSDSLEDITIKQFILLVMISHIDKPSPSVQEIANCVGTSRQNTKKMLEALSKKGYVSLRKSEEDKRSFCVSLTRKCHEYFKAHNDVGEEIISQLFRGVNESDVAAVCRVIETLHQNIMKLKNSGGEIDENKKH